MLCIECSEGEEKRVKATEVDPRNPPIAEGLCLCTSCALSAWEEVEERLEIDLGEARDEIKRLGKKR